MTTRVDDGRGGSDTQSFAIDVSSAAPAQIRGSVFNDLNGNGTRDATAEFLYWSNDDKQPPSNQVNLSTVKRVRLDGTGIETVLPAPTTPDGYRYQAIAFDQERGLLYTAHGNTLIRTNLDGSGRVVLATTPGPTSITDIELDLVHGKIYWSNNGAGPDGRASAQSGLWRANLDGSGAVQIIPASVASGIWEGVAVDPVGGKVYFTAANRLMWANLDGSDVRTFLNTGVPSDPFEVEFDPVERKVYWNEQAGGRIGRVNADGTGAETILRPPDGLGNGITFDPVGRKVYFNRYGALFGPDWMKRIQRVNPDGTGLEDFVRDPSDNPTSGVNYQETVRVPEPGLAGRTVYIDDNANGRRDPGERSAVTDQYGLYTFQNLPPGTYTIGLDPTAGWTRTAPPGGTFTVAVGPNDVVTGRDFGSRTANDSDNRPPVIISPAPTAATVGRLLRYDAASSDPDGDAVTYDLVVKPAGMAVDPATGVVVWTPTADQLGGQDVTLRASDGRGGVALQSFRVTVGLPNTAPVITSAPTGPAAVGLPWRYQVTAQDADGDPVTFAVSGPAGMTIDPATGLVSWTPAANQVGTQHVTVTASDGRGGTATQSFDLPVVATATNRPPSITSAPRGPAQIGTPYAYQVVATDPDGDPLAYSLTTAPAGMTISAAGLVSWTPTAAQAGNNAVAVRVSDGRGGVATQSFTLPTVAQSVNRPPTITSTPPGSATVGQAYSYNLAGTDPDGDPLAWTLDSAPAGMSIDPQRGTLRWTPTADQLGPRSIIVRASDGRGGSATQSFTVTVFAVDRPPSITSNPPTAAAVGAAYSYPVGASDPDGDPLTFSLPAAPTGMTIDASSGLVSWTPTSAQLGPRAVTVRAEDGRGGFAEQSFTVFVSATAANRPPVVTSTPPFAATVGQAYSYPVAATDPDGDALTFLLLAGPAGMTINAATGVVSWTPTVAQVGTQTVTVAATDPSGAGGTQTYTVAVAVANRGPTITSTPVHTVTAGLPYRYDVRASDPDGDPITFRLDQAPAGMAIDSVGRITWAPGIPDVGTRRVAVTVEDSRGASVTQTFDLAVLADTLAPRVNLSVSDNPVDVGTPVTFVVTATDNVGVASLSLSVGGAVVPLDGAGRATITRPAGNYAVVATARDAAGLVGTASTTLLVVDRSDATPPDVDITSPADGAVVTGPVDVVGTASDANLVSYVLEVAPADGSAPFAEFARGTQSVVGRTLGRFDPTGLANDSYVIRLTATDAGGNVSRVSQTVEVAGDLKVGNFTLSFTDLSVPVSGVPITLSRTYDTLQANRQDDFGYGWRMEFRDTDLRTNVPPTGEEEYGSYNPFGDRTRVYVTLPGGRREGFTFKPQRQGGFGGLFGFYKPAFVADPGVTDRLSVPDDVTLIFAGGGYYSLNELAYNPADALNFAGKYTVTTKDGLAYSIDAVTGDLDTVTDPHGNVLTFTDAAITSSAGPRVTFGRDPQGRITSVTDPAGHTVRYQYDLAGDLVAVTDRDGNVTRFEYGSAAHPHFLTKVVDPLGRAGVRTEYDAQGRLITLVDAAGNPVRLAHDPDHSLETVTDALGRPTTFEYDARGNVTTEVDALGGVTRRTYDANNFMTSETDPLGRTRSFTYDGDGNVLTETDPLGNVTRNTYQTVTPGLFARVRGARPMTLLATTTDPLGNTTTNAYDADGNLTSSTDAAGKVTRYAYDGAGNQTSVTDPAGGVTRFTYDGRGDLTLQKDALGHDTSYTYDSNGNQTSQTTTLTTPGGVRTLVTRTTYDASGRPLAVTDAEGHTTRTEYDALGRQSATVDALGHRTAFTYDDRGELTRTDFADGTFTATTYDAAGHRVGSTDRAGRVTNFVYDALGRLTETIEPDATPATLADNPRTRTEYDAAGEVTAQIDELGHRTEFAYDPAGRQTLVRDALGHQSLTSYDTAGRTASATDVLGHVTRFTYDAVGRQLRTTFADGTHADTAYDALGRVTSRTDQNGVATRYEYDALGRLTAVVDALNQRTRYGYDEAGNLVTQTDADNHTTRYEYDGLGRRTATVLPMGQRSHTDYDAAGNVSAALDFNGAEILYEYDANNRLAAKHLPDGTTVSFTYTPDGQRETVTDSRGVTRYTYDERNRLASRTDPDGTVIAYAYDAAGNRTSVTTPAGTTRYTFDALNRTATVTDPQNGVTAYQYDAVGDLARTDLPNATFETRQYDPLNRLVFLENRSPGGVIDSFRYTLDAAGNRTRVAEDTGRAVNYTYDSLYRLTGEAITDASAGNRTLGYTYDAAGNRLTRTDTAEGTTAYAYDANDRLLRETRGTAVTAYTYDANGNTLTRDAGPSDRAAYTWDAENRLVAADVTDATGTKHITNRYDADGIRVSQSVDGAETRYLIDAVQAYPQVLVEYRPSGLVLVSYAYGNDLISENRGGSRSFYHADGLGSTRALTNAAGQVTDRYAYEAFGRTIGQTGSTPNSYLFAGEQRDAGLGLDYLRARYLNVGTGRFVNRDTYPDSVSDPLSGHRYLYARSNPVSEIDPTGLSFFTLTDVSLSLGLIGLFAIPYATGFGRVGVSLHGRVQSLSLLERVSASLISAVTSDLLPVILVAKQSTALHISDTATRQRQEEGDDTCRERASLVSSSAQPAPMPSPGPFRIRGDVALAAEHFMFIATSPNAGTPIHFPLSNDPNSFGARVDCSDGTSVTFRPKSDTGPPTLEINGVKYRYY